jgi:hypothetical protein
MRLSAKASVTRPLHMHRYPISSPPGLSVFVCLYLQGIARWYGCPLRKTTTLIVYPPMLLLSSVVDRSCELHRFAAASFNGSDVSEGDKKLHIQTPHREISPSRANKGGVFNVGKPSSIKRTSFALAELLYDDYKYIATNFHLLTPSSKRALVFQ